ncbi:hypothetical protein LBMAG14_12120 [Actinomycetes bacterium]|nr:hypothetical protein LBMAG14_12120 [Actinomycetes bacterium]
MNEKLVPVGWLRTVVIDANSPAVLANFWKAVLGVEIIENEDDWIRLGPDSGGACMAFEPAPAGAAPTGFRTRADIEVEDMEIARQRIEELGGRFVEAIHARPGESHYRMADPEGNEFTVVLPDPPEAAKLLYGPSGRPH